MAAKPLVDVEGCKNSQSYDTFVGSCKCGGVEAGPTVLQELVDYSITDAMPSILASNKAGENGTDFGAVYVKASAQRKDAVFPPSSKWFIQSVD